MAKDPAFVFYTGDFLNGVIDMTMEERGQYITLLCFQHQKGHISQKMIDLNMPNVSQTVLDKFKIDEEGKYYNERMEYEIDKRAKFCEHQRENGKKGGRPKKVKVEEELSDWDEMLKFFDNTCIKCGYKFEEGDRPTKDHIVPKTWGGSDDISNLQPLCRQCNASKNNRYAEDFRLNYIADIPQRLKEKWFKEENNLTNKKPNKNQNYPKKKPLENENDNNNILNNIIDNDIVIDYGLDNIVKDNYSNIYTYIEDNFGRTISPIEFEKISKWEDSQLTRYAIKKAVLNNKKSISYIDKILENYKSEGIKSVEQAIENDKKFKKSREIVLDEEHDDDDYNWLEEV